MECSKNSSEREVYGDKCLTLGKRKTTNTSQPYTRETEKKKKKKKEQTKPKAERGEINLRAE